MAMANSFGMEVSVKRVVCIRQAKTPKSIKQSKLQEEGCSKSISIFAYQYFTEYCVNIQTRTTDFAPLLAQFSLEIYVISSKTKKQTCLVVLLPPILSN